MSMWVSVSSLDNGGRLAVDDSRHLLWGSMTSELGFGYSWAVILVRLFLGSPVYKVHHGSDPAKLRYSALRILL